MVLGVFAVEQRVNNPAVSLRQPSPQPDAVGKDPVVPQLGRRLQLRFSPWPGNFHVLQGQQKKKRKESSINLIREAERPGKYYIKGTKKTSGWV